MQRLSSISTRLVVAVLERRNEGRQRAELAQPAQALERGHGSRRERLLDALDGQIPRRQPHDPVHRSQRREAVG